MTNVWNLVTYDPDDVPLIEEIPTGDPRKTLVLDSEGDAHGTIANLAISSDDTIETIHTSENQQLDGARLLVIESYAAIIKVE